MISEVETIVVKIDAKRRIVLMIENQDLNDLEFKIIMLLADNKEHRLSEIFEYVTGEKFEPHNPKKNAKISSTIRHLVKKGFPIIKGAPKSYLEYTLEMKVFIE